MFKWVCNLTLDNSIEIKDKELGPYVTIEYVDLYRDFSHRRLQEVFSTLHSLLTTNYNAMNSRLPTGDTVDYAACSAGTGCLMSFSIFSGSYFRPVLRIIKMTLKILQAITISDCIFFSGLSDRVV